MGLIRKVSLLALFLIVTLKMSAVYVKNMPLILTLPDNTELHCFITGDEYVRTVHDKDGYTIVQGNTDGYYYYAVLENDTLVASKYKVGSVDPSAVGLQVGVTVPVTQYNIIKNEVQSSVPQRIRSVIGSAQATGVLANIVVYVRFKGDTEFPKTRKDYSLMLDNPSTTATSMNAYYKEISYGKQSINSQQFPVCDSTISLSYEDIYQRAYYTPYNASTNTIGYNGDNGEREQALVARALNTIKSQIPANVVVDNDGDGYVDNVTIVVRGNADGWGNLLWPHQWTMYLSSATLAGKQVGRYIFITENMYTQVTLCHEMFHVIGAPDLYHYTGNGIVPAGGWDLMENGSGHPLAYTKWKYSGQRWITNIPEITKSGTYSIKPLVNATQNCYKIKSPNSTSEFFVVEYRRFAGLYEKNLPGMGLIITRINTYAAGNGNGPPDEIYVVRPQGSIYSNGNLSIANFSNYALRTAFNGSSNPRAFLSDGSDAGIDIYNITLKGDSMLFSVNIPTATYQKTGWLVTTDSYESASAYSPGNCVIDNKPGTIWHTPWSSNVTQFPHWLQVNYGRQMNIRGFRYLPRQDMENGRIKDFEFYTSNDASNWNKVASGTFPNSASPQTVTFAEANCRYVKLIGKNEVNGKAFASMAELDFVVTPSALSRKKWTVLSVSSYEAGKGAALTFDSIASTFWSSKTTAPAVAYPHELAIDMNDTCCIDGAVFLPRQDGAADGTIAKYEFYTSMDATAWTLVRNGQWANNTGEKKISFEKSVCRYFKIKALSEVSSKMLATLSEIMVYGAKSNDIVVPQKPENLVVSRAVTLTSAKLTWSKDLADKTLLYYRAYAGDSLLGDVYANELTVKIDTAKNYTFKLVAVDGSGNKSEAAQTDFSGITGTVDIAEVMPVVYTVAHKILISKIPTAAAIDVYNSIGQLIYAGSSNDSQTEIEIKNNGLYIVQVKPQGGKLVVRKVLVL